MQPKTVAYPAFLIIELLRLLVVMYLAASTARDDFTWYAALPALCVAPALWLMLAVDETRFALWLPLLSLLKALSAVSFLAFAIRILPMAVAFGLSGRDNPAAALPAAGAFILVDVALGVYAYRRYRALCK